MQQNAQLEEENAKLKENQTLLSLKLSELNSHFECLQRKT